MNSFVKPSARAKFGIAAASSVALVAAPTLSLPSSAATFSVTNCNTSGAGSLHAAVDAANSASGSDVIEIQVSSECTITTSDGLIVSESVSINNESEYHFTLALHPAHTGPLISVAGTTDTYQQVDLSIDGLRFDGNNIFTGYAMIQADSDFYVANIIIYNSSFFNAERSAIRVVEQNGLDVHYSTFSDNSGILGGAIQSTGTDVLVHDSNFTSNNAAFAGGAISHSHDDNYGDGEQLTIVGSVFTGNSASQGGAVYINSDEQGWAADYEGFNANLVIQESYFYNNDASIHGGAIFANQATLTLWGVTPPLIGVDEVDEYEPFNYGSVFSGNSANYGGAIMLYASGMISAGNEFAFNSATTNGGAVYSVGPKGEDANSALILYGDYLHDNSAGHQGGAIHAVGMDEVAIAVSSVIQNYSTTLGALSFALNAEASVVGNTIAYNDSGAAWSALVLNSTGYNDVVMQNTFMSNYPDSDASYPYAVALLGSSYSVSVGGNIFASADSTEEQIQAMNPQIDLGANLVTGPVTSIGAGNIPRYPAPLAGGSAMVEWTDLDLQSPEVNADNPENFMDWPSVRIGDDSVARDYFTLDSEGISFDQVDPESLYLALAVDSRFVTRVDGDGNPIFGDGFDVGAYEIGWALGDNGILPNVAITDVSKDQIAAGGDSFSVYGRGLDDVTEFYIGEVKVSFTVVSATELLVTTGTLPVGAKEILAVATDGRATFQLPVGVVGGGSYWTKNLGNGQAKIYGKNIVGQGKVQFFLNGKEIAWIKAIDETDPKLRKANGAAYLVRTVKLVSGKNRLEVKVNGQRVRLTTYTR